MTTPPAQVQPSRAAFAFIFVTVALDMLALGVMIPVLPKLVILFEGGDIARAASVTGVFGFVWAAMQFGFSPVIGALSDAYGRRKVVLLSNFGLGVDYIFMALAPSLPWLFVGRIISGITSATNSTAAAYIADVTPVEKRAGRFGMLGAAFGLGFVVGPAMGGLLGEFDLRLPFWVAAALNLANGAYGFFVLPESLPPERRTPMHWTRMHPLGSLRFLGSRAGLRGLGAATFLFFLAHEVLPSMFVLYTDYRYHWSERTVGIALAIVGICTTIVSLTLVGPVVSWLGERRCLLLGLTFGTAGMVCYGLASTSTLFMTGIPLLALWGIAGPALQALMSRSVDVTEQGQLQGAMSSLRGVTGMLGPPLFTQTFAWALRGAYQGILPHVPGAPYLLAALLMAATFAVAWVVTRPSGALRTR